MQLVCLAISQQTPPSQEACWVVTTSGSRTDHPLPGRKVLCTLGMEERGVEPTLGLEGTPQLREFPWSVPPGNWPQS